MKDICATTIRRHNVVNACEYRYKFIMYYKNYEIICLISKN